jgi:hypothetical protein
MDNGRVSEAMFTFKCSLDSFISTGATDEWKKWHHLLNGNKWVCDVGFPED